MPNRFFSSSSLPGVLYSNQLSLRFAPGLGHFDALCESLHLGLSKEEERSKFLFSVMYDMV
jgi:hypothetical protein